MRLLGLLPTYALLATHRIFLTVCTPDVTRLQEQKRLDMQSRVSLGL